MEWVAVPFFRDLPDPGIEPTSLMSPTLAAGFFASSTTCLLMAVGESPEQKQEPLGSDREGVNCLAHEAIMAQQT